MDDFISAFELVAETKLIDEIPVKKYKSTNTGLTVVLGDIEGPIVSGKFVVLTEASDNDGLPHTLEHLISLGSEEYPFKGVLDLVANRSMASGTNAWTDDDHTCYTIECVGAEGFLRTLPVYMDHILYPMLTDSAFVTEVHHITGEGKNGGVVYCEMQGLENTGEARINLELMKELYAGTGYAVQCGGLMENLRNSTTNEKIREFHKKFYRPENLTLIIGGQVDPNEVFEALIPIEKKILSKGDLPPWTRPWKTRLEPLEETKTITIFYPDDDETNGIVAMGYRGPELPSQVFIHQACVILLRYLSETTTSPLKRDMVEIDDPFASGICCYASPLCESFLQCSFRNVPLKKMDEVYDKYFSVLCGIANGDEPIDMKRMQEVIEKEMFENLSSIETYPHMVLSSFTIIHTVHADDDVFDEWLNPNRYIFDMRNEEEPFWIEILKKYLIDANYVTVKAFPSKHEKDYLAIADQTRVELRKKTLGPEGLLKMANQLKEATEANDVPPPESMITNFPIPDFNNIGNHPVEIYRPNEDPKPTMLDLDQFPVYTEVIDIHSKFVYVTASINTENIAPTLRQYLPLFLELLAKSPIMRDGEVIPYDQVVNQFESDTISFSNDIGVDGCCHFFCGDFSNNLFIALHVVPLKYDLAAKWLYEILTQTIFELERVGVTANRLLNNVAQMKRNGFGICFAMALAMIYKNTSNISLVSLLKQKQFLTDLLKRLEDPTGAEGVLEDLKTLQKLLMQGPNISLHIATNWNKVSTNEIDPADPFQILVDTKVDVKQLRIVPDHEFENPDGNLGERIGLILGLGAVETTYLYSIVETKMDHSHPDIPAMMLFGQYLTQVEGPYYREIRGKGYSYGYAINVLTKSSLLTFHLYQSTNLVEAYKAATALFFKHISDNAVWDLNLLQSAKTSLICKIVEREESLKGVVTEAILSSFKKVSKDYNKELIKKVNEVTEEDLKRVGEEHMHFLFGAAARTAIVCHPDKCKEIKASLEEEFDYLKFRIEPSLEESILA